MSPVHKDKDLRQLADDLHNLLLATDIVALFLDRELHIRRFTPRAGELFQLSLAEQGRSLDRLKHNLHINLLDAATQIIQGHVVIEREVSSDDAHWYRVQLRPYLSSEERINGVVITFADITQVKQIEQALHENEEWTRLAVESVQEYAIFTTDKMGKIASWNQGAERILLYTDAEVIGRPGAIIFTPEDRARGAVEGELTTAVREGQALDERWHIRKDQSRFWASGVMTALRNEAGELRGFVKVMRDNTERKQAEEALHASQVELQALNESLAARVEERTLQVRNLAAELVLAEQKERQRLAQLLHDDLQQILYGMQIHLSLLNEVQRPHETTELLDLQQMLKGSLLQAIQLTRQLTLDLSPPVLESDGLVEMLRWLAVHMYQLHGLTTVVDGAVNVNLPNREVRILLVQLVRELLFNVVKHAGVKQAHLELRTEDGRLLIEVSDQGQGFDVTSVTDAAMPTGYGLHSVQARLALFEGKIVVTSQRGAGAKITLYVPL
ncbi:N/A [soil metagenome]